MRLDSYLVENNLAQSRNKAQSLIKEGLVSVNGKIINKSAFKLTSEDRVRVGEHKAYVSRGAYKLLNFLAEIKLELKGKNALDIGSSTGGFTQVLLEAEIGSVHCVDVGTQQLHHSIRADKRVHVHEQCDIRDFQSDTQFDLVVSDVAFISLLYILEDVNRLASSDIILLFKPQFEVGREVKRDKHGVVLDNKAIAKAMQKFEDACALQKWSLQNKMPSSVTGKEGNLEYCYYFKKEV